MPCCNVTINKNRICDVNCNKNNCTCIPTDGKPCICLCQKDGAIVRCDSCDNTECVCLCTGGLTCLCVGRDEKGNIKVCDGCMSVKPNIASTSDTKDHELSSGNSGICIQKKKTKSGADCTCDEVKRCDTDGCICTETNDKSCICVYKDNEEIAKCENWTCEEPKKGTIKCACIKTDGNSCICVCKKPNEEVVRCDNCQCDDSKNCGKAGCDCIQTDGKSCIFVCEEGVEKLVRFENSTCAETKKDTTKCACILTDGNSCICVCKKPDGDVDGKLVRCESCKCEEGKYKTSNCDDKCCNECSCVSTHSDKKQVTTKENPCICVCKKPDEEVRCVNCQCDDYKKCDKVGCDCI